jgi:hypothetical protein
MPEQGGKGTGEGRDGRWRWAARLLVARGGAAARSRNDGEERRGGRRVTQQDAQYYSELISTKNHWCLYFIFLHLI